MFLITLKKMPRHINKSDLNSGWSRVNYFKCVFFLSNMCVRTNKYITNNIYKYDKICNDLNAVT